jgi:hypothetical protein
MSFKSIVTLAAVIFICYCCYHSEVRGDLSQPASVQAVAHYTLKGDPAFQSDLADLNEIVAKLQLLRDQSLDAGQRLEKATTPESLVVCGKACVLEAVSNSMVVSASAIDTSREAMQRTSRLADKLSGKRTDLLRSGQDTTEVDRAIDRERNSYYDLKDVMDRSILLHAQSEQLMQRLQAGI